MCVLMFARQYAGKRASSVSPSSYARNDAARDIGYSLGRGAKM